MKDEIILRLLKSSSKEDVVLAWNYMVDWDINVLERFFANYGDLKAPTFSRCINFPIIGSLKSLKDARYFYMTTKSNYVLYWQTNRGTCLLRSDAIPNSTTIRAYNI